MNGLTGIDITIVIFYLSAVLIAGLYFSKSPMQGKSYFKGDGTIPWWVTSVSIFATLLSPISFLSIAGNSYSGTWVLWFAQLGIFIAVPLTIKLFLPVYSKLKIDTAYHYLELRYKSKGLRVLGAILFIIYQIGRMSIIMYLPSIVLSQLLGINTNLLIVIMGIIAIVYSYGGGLKSVVWTDFIQGVVLIAGILFTLVYLIFSIDGNELSRTSATDNRAFHIPHFILLNQAIGASGGTPDSDTTEITQYVDWVKYYPLSTDNVVLNSSDFTIQATDFNENNCVVRATFNDNCINKALSWKSNNESVITVHSGFCVAASSSGSATITATSKSGVSKSITLNVSNNAISH